MPSTSAADSSWYFWEGSAGEASPREEKEEGLSRSVARVFKSIISKILFFQ